MKQILMAVSVGAYAALARHFPGFTAYRDNLGMHTGTRTEKRIFQTFDRKAETYKKLVYD